MAEIRLRGLIFEVVIDEAPRASSA